MSLPRTTALLVALAGTAGCPPAHDKPGEDADDTNSDTGCTEPWCNTDFTTGDDDDDDDNAASADDDDDDDSADDDDDDDDDASGDECQVSADCAPEFCVAPFNPALGIFGRGDFECVSECVDLLDELRWCADREACCDPRAECTDRGYCELLDPGGDSTGNDTAGDDTAGDDTAGDDTAGEDTAGEETGADGTAGGSEG